MKIFLCRDVCAFVFGSTRRSTKHSAKEQIKEAKRKSGFGDEIRAS
jgi:hypothetical protein